MALLTGKHTWFTGERPSHAPLNTEFSSFLADYNGNITSPNLASTGLVYLPSGTTLEFRDASGAQPPGLIAASGVATDKYGGIFGAAAAGWMSNMRLSASSGTFTIGPNAVLGAFSTTTPGWITCPSVTGGRTVSLAITANATFTDDTYSGTSSFLNRGFGITESVAWGSACPFYVYVVNKADSVLNGADGNSLFFVARVPWLVKTPGSSTKIGNKSAPASSDTVDSIMLLHPSATVANYTGLPCVCVGVFSATWSAVSADWTVNDIGPVLGMGLDRVEAAETLRWTFPLNQNGAGAASHFLPNGGTAPSFTDYDSALYTLTRWGQQLVSYEAKNTAGGTAGAGAVSAYLAVPNTFPISQSDALASVVGSATTTAMTNGLLVGEHRTDAKLGLRFRNGSFTVVSDLTLAAFANANRGLSVLVVFEHPSII